MKLILNFLIFLTLYQFGHAFERVKLKDVQALTLYKDRYTVGRKPIPQLSCSGSLCRNHHPHVVQCVNVGSDGTDSQWKCNANLDKNVKFSSISVNCEGYDYPNDPYIVAGSCGLEFQLAQNSHDHRENHNTPKNITNDASSIPFWIFISFVALFVIIMLCKSSDETVRDREGYSYQEPTAPPGFKPQFTEPNYHPPPTYQQSSNYQQSSGPGFWSGLGLGGLSGFFLGRNTSSSHTSPPVYTDYNYYRPSRSSYQDNTFYQDDCYSDRSSGETYTAEGFGGTKRR